MPISPTHKNKPTSRNPIEEGKEKLPEDDEPEAARKGSAARGQL
jgi:hypothetical protein